MASLRFARSSMAALVQLLALTAHAAPVARDQPSEWRSWNNTSYRIEEDGHFSCYSEDGVRCKAGLPSSDIARWRPVSCGPGLLSRTGRTGYDTHRHWCNDAHANTFAQWRDHGLVGHPLLLAENANGDTMCVSYQDSACVALPTRGQRPHETLPIIPRVCGPAMRGIAGISGYELENRAHWCQSMKIVAQWFDAPETPQSPASADTASFLFALPAWRPVDGRRGPAWLLELDGVEGSSPVLSVFDASGNGAMNLLSPPWPTFNRKATVGYAFGERLVVHDGWSTGLLRTRAWSRPTRAFNELTGFVHSANHLILDFKDSDARHWSVHGRPRVRQMVMAFERDLPID